MDLSLLNRDELCKLRDKIDSLLEEKSKGMNLPPEMGKRAIDRILKVYSILWHRKYGIYPKVQYLLAAKLFKPLFKEFSEYQIGLLIAVHMNWRGTNGDSEFIEKRLLDNGHPITWIPKSVNEYILYIINNQGIDFNNESIVKETLDRILK